MWRRGRPASGPAVRAAAVARGGDTVAISGRSRISRAVAVVSSSICKCGASGVSSAGVPSRCSVNGCRIWRPPGRGGVSDCWAVCATSPFGWVGKPALGKLRQTARR